MTYFNARVSDLTLPEPKRKYAKNRLAYLQNNNKNVVSSASKKKQKQHFLNQMYKPKDIISKDLIKNEQYRKQETENYFKYKYSLFNNSLTSKMMTILNKNESDYNQLFYDHKTDTYTVDNQTDYKALNKVFSDKSFQTDKLYQLYYKNRKDGLKHNQAKKLAKEQLKISLAIVKSRLYDY